MPTVIVENVPPEVMLHLAQEALRAEAAPAPRLPDLIPAEEVSAPCNLPRSSQPVAVPTYRGRPRLPGPLPE